MGATRCVARLPTHMLYPLYKVATGWRNVVQKHGRTRLPVGGPLHPLCCSVAIQIMSDEPLRKLVQREQSARDALTVDAAHATACTGAVAGAAAAAFASAPVVAWLGHENWYAEARRRAFMQCVIVVAKFDSVHGVVAKDEALDRSALRAALKKHLGDAPAAARCVFRGTSQASRRSSELAIAALDLLDRYAVALHRAEWVSLEEWRAHLCALLQGADVMFDEKCLARITAYDCYCMPTLACFLCPPARARCGVCGWGPESSLAGPVQ